MTRSVFLLAIASLAPALHAGTLFSSYTATYNTPYIGLTGTANGCNQTLQTHGAIGTATCGPTAFPIAGQQDPGQTGIFAASATGSAAYGALFASGSVAESGTSSGWAGTVYGSSYVYWDDTVTLDVTGGGFNSFYVQYTLTVSGGPSPSNSRFGSLQEPDSAILTYGINNNYGNNYQLALPSGTSTYTALARVSNHGTFDLRAELAVTADVIRGINNLNVPYGASDTESYTAQITKVEVFQANGFSVGAPLLSGTWTQTGSTGVPYSHTGQFAPAPEPGSVGLSFGGLLLVAVSIGLRRRRSSVTA